MKEFELKYKSALGTATTMYACAKESNDKKMIQTLELIFPELKKTKDELIKEELIHFLETCQDTRFVGNRKRDKWIEWLENNQICDMPKIEFKVGDWVIFKGGIHASVYKVEKLENYEYTLEHFLGGSMPLPFGNQSLLRPWTIQDAKDGDILVNKSRTFIYREYDDSSIGYYASFYPRGRNKLLFNGAFFITPDIIKDIYPATKEQRDLLFQKIEEAGYEWDNNKKELIKHEQ